MSSDLYHHPMTAVPGAAARAAIGAARELRLPAARGQAARLAEIAIRERRTRLACPAGVRAAGLDDRAGRRHARRIAKARFPRIRRLAGFSARRGGRR